MQHVSKAIGFFIPKFSVFMGGINYENMVYNIALSTLVRIQKYPPPLWPDNSVAFAAIDF